jgi:uncharacterized membrane-anchored protein YhcB (DUF1043 family)
MPVIYGEGRDRAVNRLRKEINEALNINSQNMSTYSADYYNLYHHRGTSSLTVHLVLDNVLKYLSAANDAPFNSQAKQHEPICLQETRVNLLRDIDSWADGQDECCLF